MKQRKIIRLKDYNYSQNGYYFITIRTYRKICLFGYIKDEIIQNNIAGKMIEKWYLKIKSKYTNIKCHEYIIMPNHAHFIIEIRNKSLPNGHVGPSLQTMMQWFKTMTTNEYINMVKQNIAPRFNGKLWQKSFYDHIIRNDEALNRIRKYILNNPSNWNND